MEALQNTLTIEDAMAYFRVSKSTIQRAIRSGKLKSYKFGQQRRIKHEWLLEFEADLIASAEAEDRRET